MSDTPKTDAQTHDPIEYDSMGGWSWSPYNMKPQPDGDWVPADFARELERENAALKQRIIDDNKAYGCEIRDAGGTIWDHAQKLQKENAALRERLHNADAEIDMWASRCAAAVWMLPEHVTGGKLREAQDKFHRMLHAARKEAQP